MVVASPDGLGALFDVARECLDEERRRTADEREALETFVDEVRGLSVDSGSVEPQRAPVATRTTNAYGGADGLVAVRDAYEATLMNVPHYEEEYDDTYVQSVAEEFGPDVATMLTERTAFDDRCKRAVLAAVMEAQEPRETLLRTLDAESDSIEAARERLSGVVEELTGFAASGLTARNFETLDAYRARLVILAEQCDELAAHRQSTLREQRHRLGFSVEDLDVPTYVYQPLDVDYPVLSAVTAVADRVDETRASVERAMGYCN